MHLAAALGIPLVAIFGSTDERATGPIGTRVRIVKQPWSVAPAGGACAPSISAAWSTCPVEEVYRATLEFVKRWNLANENPGELQACRYSPAIEPMASSIEPNWAALLESCVERFPRQRVMMLGDSSPMNPCMAKSPASREKRPY